jgi:hypothetical protein
VKRIGEIETLLGPVQRPGGELRILQRYSRQAGEIPQRLDEPPGREAVAASEYPFRLRS